MDFSIIYLSMSAPFLVYFYHQLRQPLRMSDHLFLIVRALSWPFFASVLTAAGIRKNLFGPKSVEHISFDARIDVKVEAFSLLIDDILLQNGRRADIRHARLLIERYAELTIAVLSDYSAINGFETEFFLFTGHQKAGLAAICLKRRNLVKLSRHHIGARREFQEFIRTLLDLNIMDGVAFTGLAELTESIDDYEFLKELSEIATPVPLTFAHASESTRRKLPWGRNTAEGKTWDKHSTSDMRL